MFAADGGLFGSEGEGNPYLSEVRLDHLWAHDADDGVGLSVESDASSDCLGVGGVVGLPELVAEDDLVILPGVIFFGEEDASVKRFDAEDGEEFGLTALARIDSGFPAPVMSNPAPE
jgi:hypothetical protein